MHAVIIALLCNEKQFQTLLPDFIAHFFLSGSETAENADDLHSSFNFIVM